LPPIIEHPSPNRCGRKGTAVDVVLLHHTGPGSDAGHLSWLCNPSPRGRGGQRVPRVSAHYLVGTGGTVWRLVPESEAAYHAGLGRLPWETRKPYNFNLRSIGIELVNPGDGRTPFTEAQYGALAWLLPDIVRRLAWSRVYLRCQPGSHDIPAWSSGRPRGVTGDVLGHRDVAPGRKVDPADNFEWERIRQALRAPSPVGA
jgi:N-acetylmuramoyl-L-alanine amidase